MWVYKTKQGHAHTMPIFFNRFDTAGGPWPLIVLPIALESMGMVSAYPCLDLEAQIFEKHLYRERMGSSTQTSKPSGHAQSTHVAHQTM